MLVYGVVVRLMANEDLIVFIFLGKIKIMHFCQVTFIYIALYAIDNLKVTSQ